MKYILEDDINFYKLEKRVRKKRRTSLLGLIGLLELVLQFRVKQDLSPHNIGTSMAGSSSSESLLITVVTGGAIIITLGGAPI